MYRAQPIFNRICNDKEVERNKDIHKQKINNMQSTFRQMSPQNYSVDYKLSRHKREQLNESRFTEIERENRLLLEKITSIMVNRQPQNLPHTPGVSPKSLNQHTRKRFVSNIFNENTSILKRLQEKRSAYSVKQWEQDYQKSQELAEKISLYPLSIGTTKHNQNRLSPLLSEELTQTSKRTEQFSSQQKRSPKQLEELSEFALKQQQKTANTLVLTQNENNYGENNTNLIPFSRPKNRRSMNKTANYEQGKGWFPQRETSQKINMGKMNENASTAQNNNNRAKSRNNRQENYLQQQEKSAMEQFFPLKISTIVLFRASRMISGYYFDVEVRIQDDFLLILAEHKDSQELKVIEIPQQEGEQFIQEECDQDISSLVLRLRLHQGKMFLIGTKNRNREGSKQNKEQQEQFQRKDTERSSNN